MASRGPIGAAGGANRGKYMWYTLISRKANSYNYSDPKSNRQRGHCGDQKTETGNSELPNLSERAKLQLITNTLKFLTFNLDIEVALSRARGITKFESVWASVLPLHRGNY